MKYRYRSVSFVLQVLGSFLFLSLPLLFLNDTNLSLREILKSESYWLFGGSFLSLYFFNAFVLIPWLFAKKQYGAYAAILLVLLTLFCVLKPFDQLMRLTAADRAMPSGIHSMPPPDFGNRPWGRPDERRLRHPKSPIDVATIYIFFMMIAFGAAGRIVQYWMVTEKRMSEVEADKVKAELAFLKAQVHPHFLFNTLHNIYALALTNRPETAESIFKLAQLMRYFMEEPQNDEVPVQEEVQAMRDYIALQGLRLGASCQVEEHYDGLDVEKKIMPLLFMPFVENAFKYGVSKVKESPLFFRVSVTPQCILFSAKNRIHQQPEAETSGIGIRNTKRRLQYGYPDRHELRIEQEMDFFCVTLILDV